jgi:hypothetical protein
MFILADGKARTGWALDNPVLRTEGHVSMIDGILATAVLLGLMLNAAVGWWQADPAAGYVLVYYAAREVRTVATHCPTGVPSPSTRWRDSSRIRSSLARRSAGPPSGRPCRHIPAPRETCLRRAGLCSATAYGTPFQEPESARQKVLVRSM